MKSCPACNRTFEDTFSFCLVDGSVLSAPFDPGAVRSDSFKESDDPLPTEVISADAPAALKPTQASPVPPVPPPGPTIRASFQPAQPVSPSGTRETFATGGGERKPNLLVWMLGGIALLLVIVVAVLSLRNGSQEQTARVEPTANNKAASPPASPTPDKAKKHRDQGSVFKDQKRYAEAETEYREAIRLDPNDPNAHVGLAYVLTRVKRNAEAEAEYREALRVKPDMEPARVAAIRYNIGKALYDQEKYTQAEAEYREAIRLDPKMGLAHMNLGLALYQQKRYAEAESELREAVRLDPNSVNAHHNLATVLENQNKSAEARAEYAKAAELKKQESP